ncbi:hypothetical protein C5167_001104 [Papaver somniferum]|uniref:Pro-apoptotic serine protease NMA111 n=1 Tax=Papaver somniferum TaxID=3469 RepID=A0A4Y7KVN5_PAPSO|nr:hypothetical protein C5167_001104 [Papaver somniferum]
MSHLRAYQYERCHLFPLWARSGRTNSASAEDWRKAISKVVPAVVVLKVTACKAFDTECAGYSCATGFVVDKKRGIILTNRHVVQSGPVVAEAMFVNREEIPVFPIYRDPVHDFGFFRYDPDTVQFLSYEEIPLAPEAASVGLEIRVVGNDSNEQVSILTGTLARLDRDAPRCRYDGYNDFNTFYMQAASGTKGGSSGSPVVDWLGRAVALNAAGKEESASAFFLPLERVVRALSYIQKSKDSCGSGWGSVTIPRGTLQATFLHKGFNETRGIGLTSKTEQMVRHASPAGETGMLVVDSVVPDGPAHKLLEPGDVLVRVNGEVITHFLKLETLLDNSVDQKIDLLIERGDSSLIVNIKVQDLHSITPNSFLEVSGAVIQSLSYHQARNFRFKCGLVYVTEPGYMLSRAAVPRHAIIKKFAGKEILKLYDLISVLSELSKGARVPLEYISYWDRHRSKSVLVTVDQHEWYAPPQIYTRDDSIGLWTSRPALPHRPMFLSSSIKCHRNTQPSETNLLTTSEAARIAPRVQDAKKIWTDGLCRNVVTDEHVGEERHFRVESNVGTKKQRLDDYLSLEDRSIHETVEERLADTRYLENAGRVEDSGGATANASVAERVLEPTLVRLEVHVPLSCQVDGVDSQDFSGTGVIVHHSQSMGLVAVDKKTVPVSACDVMLSFAASHIETPGEVIFLHPVHNYALVAYDPSSLGVAGASVRAAKLLPEPALRSGDSVFLVGLNKSLQATSRKSNVTNPSAVLENCWPDDCPGYKATNMEVIELDTDFGRSFTGVLSDERGFVQAMWGRFSQMSFSVRGIPIYAVSEVLDKITHGGRGQLLHMNGITRPMPRLRILDAELYRILPSKARSFGLSDSWIQALVKKDPIRRQVLRVKGCLAGSKAENKLEQGDMVLAINKEPITCFQDIERACQGLDESEENNGALNMTIFRDGQEIDVSVGTDFRDGSGTTRMVHWCGCIVQEPHSAVRALGFLPEEGHGVYVSRWCGGSPAHRYGLTACLWIVEVNGKLTPDLDSFVEVTKRLEHGEFVRIRIVGLNGNPEVHKLKQDLRYWPTWELKFDPKTALWKRRTIKGLDEFKELHKSAKKT